MIDVNNISKIGIGTWGIGGFLEPDSSVDEKKQTDAIAYMLSKGLNFVEANMLYSAGKSVEILGNAIKQSDVQRKDLFVCAAIYLKGTKTLNEAQGELDSILSLLNTSYVDSLQFNMTSFSISNFDEITQWIDELLASRKIRFTSITNENLPLLKKYKEKYGNKLFSHEVVFNFEVRANEELGIIDYAHENNIKTVVYQPLRRNRTATHNWKPVVKLAEKYGKTQNQILLNWIISKGYLPLTKSENIDHINEHLEALNFVIDDLDIQLLNNFKIPNYAQPDIAWSTNSPGVRIDQLSNVFEDHYNSRN